MKPIPVVFHIGPLQIHTYGIGLAITFWFAYRYFAKRLRDNGYPDDWLGFAFVWIVISAIIGARLVHVVANWGYYSRHLADILAIWHGGLSSYGGLIFSVPLGLYIMRKRCRPLKLGRAIDLVAPVLIAAWAVGRLLGPQLMIRGGGRVTTAWYGMEYAGEAGKRIPVPIFQSIECFVIFLVALRVEKYMHARGDRPVGIVMASTAALWGISRFIDEYFWLTHDNGTDAVEAAGIAFLVLGVAYIVWAMRRDSGRPTEVSLEDSRYLEASDARGGAGVGADAGAELHDGEAGSWVPGSPGIAPVETAAGDLPG